MDYLKTISLFLFACNAVTANAQLRADFKADKTKGCWPLIVQFADDSKGNPTEWLWDLGNGATSTKKDASAAYISPGIYTIKLHIKNAGGADSIIKTNYITVYEKPVVNFTGSPTEGCIPHDVNFTDLSTAGSGTLASWLWDFGDGITTTDKNPLHTYNIVDSFNVTLEATNSFGCVSVLNKPLYIKLGGIVKADFTYQYNSVCAAPVLINFNNTSQSDKRLTYQWDFGDGSAINTEKNPKHNYATTGNFTVKLIAINEIGCSDTISENISVGISETDFLVSNTCINTPVIFSDASSAKPLSTSWNFGDGTTGSGTETTHTYNNKGSYIVTLNSDFGGCKDSIKKTIVITNKPEAEFDVIDNRYSCTYPVTIQFKNKSKDSKTYKWVFDNGTESTEETPAFTYNKPGNFDVKLIAFNESGCADTIIKKDYIQIGLPKISTIQNLPLEGCAPQTVTLNPLVNADTSIISYLWNFGDGSTSTSATPTHTYKAGVYDVKLIVTKTSGCSDSLVMRKAVTLINKPTAAFYATPTEACASTPIQFTDTSKGNITEWKWMFGPDRFTSEQNPLIYYNDTGHLSVTLIVGQYKCYDTATKKGYIHILPPTSKFASIPDCEKPFNYTFIDSSQGVTSWKWNFGDGSTANNSNPTHTYNKTGIYIVSLTTSNNVCNKTNEDTIHVIKENPAIHYQFSSSKSCKYDYIRFDIANYNPANYLAYKWDFGDGIVSSFTLDDSVVFHAYKSAGTYQPMLIMKNINNCIDTINISIKVGGPTASFSNIAGGCVNSTIRFKDASVADASSQLTKWVWNYGDNTPVDTSGNISFKHTYNTPGTFNILLKVVDNNNCYDTAIYKGLEITKPVANFKVPDTLNCSQDAIQFNNLSQGLLLNFNWDFGDGHTSTDAFPSHQFKQDGNYSVKLKTTDKYNCVDSILKPKYITVATPVANFNLNDSVFACPPAKLVPINNTSKGYKSVLWDFGDGNTSEEINPLHYYTLTGSFTVKLIVYGYGSCTDTLSKEILVKGPSAKYTYSPLANCDSVNAKFSATGKSVVNYTWDFGDGVTQTSGNDFATHTYRDVGKYVPKLVIEDSNGCQVAIINNTPIFVSSANALYSVKRMPGICDSSLFGFADSSDVRFDVINSFKWKFGDKDSATIAKPKHFYNKAGTYNTALSITTKNGCQSTYSLPLNVSIDKSPNIFAKITDSICANTAGSFTAGVTGNTAESYTWRWNFGDGNNANTQNSSHAYAKASAYTVAVSANTVAGCTTTIKDQLIVNPTPQTNAGANLVICREQSTNLQAAGAESYKWASNTSLSCINCANPIASPLSNTIYYVTGSNSFHCSSTDSIAIEVKQPPNVSINAPDTICTGTTIQLKATGAELYKWQPENLVSKSTDSVVTSSPLTPVTYTVTGTDDKGCFTQSVSSFVNVFPIPTIQLKDSIVEIGVGNRVQLNATASPDVTNLMWSPAINISCTNCPNPFVSPKQTITYSLSVSNPGSCSAKKSVTVNVFCNKDQNLFIPNAFSPNSDGMNDYFYPRGKGLLIIKSLSVFNRLGNKVFQQTNFPANQQSYGWNGKYNGKPLPADVYVYILEIKCENGQTLSSKGNITLL